MLQQNWGASWRVLSELGKIDLAVEGLLKSPIISDSTRAKLLVLHEMLEMEIQSAKRELAEKEHGAAAQFSFAVLPAQTRDTG